MKKRLERKKISTFAGVCSGLANYIGIDPVIIRALFLIVTLFVSLPIGVFTYIIIWILTPEEKNGK